MRCEYTLGQPFHRHGNYCMFFGSSDGVDTVTAPKESAKVGTEAVPGVDFQEQQARAVIESLEVPSSASPPQLLSFPSSSFFIYIYIFYLQNPDSSHTRVNFGVCWWWGCLHSADLWSRRRCTSSTPKETEDSRMKGG